MSKRRAVILSVTVEGLSQAETARLFGVSESYVSRLLARYRAEGNVAFEPRSRRPTTSPTAVGDDVVALIVNLRQDLSSRGLDAGPVTIAWHLQTQHGLTVSVSTIRRRLVDAALITPNPKKRPRSSYIRFQADLPNETWQADFTHWRLADGTDTEILTWLDDHSRFALSVTAHRPVTGPVVVDTFLRAGADQGLPASVLTDNGMVFTTRFAGGRGGRNQLETTLTDLGITQKHSRPSHPMTCGKVERFQQTLKRWLRAQATQPASLAGLQALLDRFVDHYNHQRPHRSLPGQATPAAAYRSRPKATPTGRHGDVHWRVRHDRVDTSGRVTLRHQGRLYHIGIGRTLARTPIILLVADLDVRVVHATTGELIRHLTLDPTRNYQPTGRPPGPPPRKPQQPDPSRGFGLSGMS
jgi:transposase InsO family protein